MRSTVISAMRAVIARIVLATEIVFANFQAKLIALVVASVLVPSAVMFFATLQSTEQFQTEHIRDKFSGILKVTRKEINRWHKDLLLDTERLVRSRGFLGPLERYYTATGKNVRKREKVEMEKYFAIVSEKFPGFEQFVVLDPFGGVIASSYVLSKNDRSVLDSLRVRSNKERFMSDESLSDTNVFYRWVLVPVEAGGWDATVVARVNLAGLTELLGPDALNPVGDLFILDGDGRYITQPRNAARDEESGAPANMIGLMAQSVLRGSNTEGPIQITTTTKQDFIDARGKRESRQRFISSRIHLAEYDWWLVCEDLESKVIAPVVIKKLQIMLVDFLICALFLFICWKLSVYLLRPVAALSDGARKINRGMVAVRIPGEGRDQIGQMIKAFNDMAEKITLTEAKLHATNQEIQSRNEDLERVNNELERLSITDGQTGLYNHRHFWKIMEHEVARSSRYKGELALILMDIDNFKEVNDKFGHSTGDLLIERIGRLLREKVRETDAIARYGGEEFAVLLPETSKKGALRVSEKVRRTIEGLVFKIPDVGLTLSVTVSVGVAVFERSRTKFFNDADKALYKSKSGGKNQVTFAEV
ncbi:MAG: diguanylate cyclase [bacterium]|nr:diguanylate cyclase [bacterium]